MLDSNQKLAVETVLRQVGNECILPYFRNLSDNDISFKESENDPVSIADQEAERQLRQKLLSILPDSLFVGEESYAEDPSILNHLTQNNKPVWTVDPIDGTANFVSGKEGFGIMVSLTLAGETLSCWFFEICSQELTTFHNNGTLTINGNNIFPPQQSSIPYTGQIGLKLFQFDEIQQIKQNSEKFLIAPAKNPSIINYQLMLKGKMDFLIYRVTYPWDHIAGTTLVSANGGIVRCWNGQKYQISDTHKGLVVARNQEIYKLVEKEIIQHLLKSEIIMNLESFKSS